MRPIPLTHLVGVKALAALLAKPARIHHLPEPDSGPILGVTELSVQNFHDGQACIKADEVSKQQRAHGHVSTILHDIINTLLVADTGLETDDGLIDVWHQNAIGEEAGRVCRRGGHLAHALAELHGSSKGLRRCLKAGDDLNAFLDRYGIHEVGRNYTR